MKDCMVDAINIVCPVVKPKIEAIPISKKATVCRIKANTANLQENLLNTATTLKCFSFALDESADILDTAHLLTGVPKPGGDGGDTSPNNFTVSPQ